MNTRVFQSVRRACYAGLDSVALRAEIAHRISGAVVFDAHAFGTADPSTGLLNHLVADRMPATMARAYAERLYPLHAAPHVIDRARQGRTVVRAGEESPEVVAEQRAHGFGYGTHVFLTTAGRVWGKWCLLRQDAPERSLAREQLLLRELVPHITHGLQRAAILESACGDAERNDSAAGIIVLDSRRHVIVRTPSAQPMLADLADVGMDDPDALPLSVYTCAERARNAGATRGPLDAEVSQIRARGRSGRWYVVEACVAEPDTRGRTAVVVTMRGIGARERAQLFTELYGLTSREREIVAAVSRGESTKAIAAALALSPHTVTEYLDRACEKVGVRGRKALIARLFFDVYRPRLAAPRARVDLLQ